MWVYSLELLYAVKGTAEQVWLKIRIEVDYTIHILGFFYPEIIYAFYGICENPSPSKSKNKKGFDDG